VTPTDRIAQLEAELERARANERCLSRDLAIARDNLDAERAAHARTQAEAAAMRAASTTLLRALSDSEDNADEVLADAADGLNRALTGDAGRAIAERVTLLEAMYSAAHAAKGRFQVAHDSDGQGACYGAAQCRACRFISALAALDEKGAP